MGTLRITIELDTDKLESAAAWGYAARRAASQLAGQIDAGNAAVFRTMNRSDWTERDVLIHPGGRRTLPRARVGRIVIDRSQTGWDD